MKTTATGGASADGANHSSAATLECLYRIGSLVNSTDDPAEALGLILEEIVRALGASSASIALLDPDTSRLRIEAARGHSRDTTGWEFAPGQGVTGWVALHGRPLLVPDTRLDGRYVEIKKGVLSELAVPMEMLGAVIGVVNCDSERANAFDADDQSFLGVLTGEAAKVVGRLWQMRKLRLKAARLEAVILAAQSLAHERDTPRVLADLATHTRQLAGCEAVAFYGVEDGALRLRHLDGNLPGSSLAREVATADTALGVVVSRRRQLEVARAGRNEECLFERLGPVLAGTSLLATPVVLEREVFGVLLVVQGTPHRFSDDEKRLVATLASIGASALQNARLYARVFASEESLRRGERLTLLGMLAAEIAHEIRNPLTVIKLLFDALDLRFKRGDARGEDVRVIHEKLAHLEEIVGRVLDYGRSRAVTFERNDLGDIIAGTLRLMRLKFEQSHARVEFTREGGGDAGFPVEADKGQVQQVLLNLFLNAIQAMPAGGVIRLHLWRAEASAGGAGNGGVAGGVAGAGAVAAGAVCLRVADTGGGMPAAVRERLFDSFLTGRKEGTGLGLAVAKRIMRNHHGDIALESSDTGGTVFVLWFPPVQEVG
ncbi:MAG: GAF domain-containing protein [Puniceicoccales bacterium]|jgi:signal transduction histidine kinase|nr:GAF domain-containing protein [Puniceicoccales bacterium]